MKICFFSDIHGNYEAFSAGFELILNEHADMYIFLGDICGYYFDTLKIWHELKKIKNLSYLLGNHDSFFLESYKTGKISPQYTKKYGPSLEMLLQECSEDFIKWLQKAKKVYSNKMLSLMSCHGGPEDYLKQYIYPDSPLPKSYFRYIITGHTHYPMSRLHGEHFYGNPGSIGQPRNGDCPSYAILHTEQKNGWVVRHFTYDRRPLLEKLNTMNAPAYLRQILLRQK